MRAEMACGRGARPARGHDRRAPWMMVDVSEAVASPEKPRWGSPVVAVHMSKVLGT